MFSESKNEGYDDTLHQAYEEALGMAEDRVR